MLDTSESERRPVGRLVLRSSGMIIRMAMVRTRAGRLARNTLGGAALRLPPGGRGAAGPLSGIGIDHPHAPRAVEVALQDAWRLHEVLRDGAFVLVAPESAAPLLAGRTGRVLLAPPADPTTPWTLVRPDAQVAWSGAADGLPAALEMVGPARG